MRGVSGEARVARGEPAGIRHGDLPRLAPGTDAGTVELHERWLRIRFAGGPPRFADFHYVWLRLHCDGDRHPQTREPQLDVTAVPDDLRPAAAHVEAPGSDGSDGSDGGALVVRWAEPGARVSRYPLGWLRAHAYAAEREEPPPPPGLKALTLDARDFKSDPELARAALQRVERGGAVLVRGYGSLRAGAASPADTEALIRAFADAGLEIVGTHFGRIEDLRTDNTTNQNTDQLGYTDAGIDLHTDQPFLDRPPRYQLLHCMRPAEVGGDSFLADGILGAQALAAEDLGAFRTLRTTQVRFHRKQRAFEREVVAPLLTLREDGTSLVRCSYFTLAPQRLPFAEVDGFFRAYRRYMMILRDERHLLRLRLQAGDFLLYDNHRMLHGRSPFQGNRWVRGVYFNERC
ncbi:MAG: TauD/TfdA family dioxygenase [Polyangia bacterium]